MCQPHLHPSSSLLLPLRRLRKTYYAFRSPPLSGRKGGHEAHLTVYGQRSLSGDNEHLKSLHSELVEELPSRGATQATQIPETQPQQAPRDREGRGRERERGRGRGEARGEARGGQIAGVPDGMMTSFQM